MYSMGITRAIRSINRATARDFGLPKKRRPRKKKKRTPLRKHEEKTTYYTAAGIRPIQEIIDMREKIKQNSLDYLNESYDLNNSRKVTGATENMSRSIFMGKGRRRKHVKRHRIADALAEVLRILRKPDGPERIFREIDRMILLKNKNKGFFGSKLPKKLREKIDSRLQGFIWATSPGIA